MRVRLNNIDFEVEAVTLAERKAVLADPTIAPAVWREIYRWDHVAQSGEMVTRGVTPQGQIVLPNGVLFYVPRSGGAEKAEGPSTAMGKRVLEALKAKGAIDIIRALASVVQIPQKKLPREPFKPIEQHASYSMRMYTEFCVLRLRNAARNLSFVVALPGQALYHHEVTAHDDAYDALVADKPDLKAIQPRFILAPTSPANRNFRVLALGAALKEMQDDIKAKTADGAKLEDRALESAFARMLTEFRVLTKEAKAAPTAVRA